MLGVSTILYVLSLGRKTEIHVSSGRVYETKATLSELERDLGDSFIKVHRGCLVSVMAIHDITDAIDLINGETLEYTKRKKKEIMDQFRAKQQHMLRVFERDSARMTAADYHDHYRCFDSLPFAFADIEMIFDEERHAVDWIFRYGNPALSALEKIPLERLIGSSFGSLFSNMDSKWLRSYERAALYGEMLEIIDYSPEIDTYLKIVCFPTFRGHCGCILFNIAEVEFAENSGDTEKALLFYLGKLTARERGVPGQARPESTADCDP